jgi:hypothetical protein
MDDFVVIRANTTQPKPAISNPVENLLKQHSSGLSLRQIKQKCGLNKRSVNYHIYNSRVIKDSVPWIHGSWKTKIRVYNYTPIEMNYFERNQKKKVVEEFKAESSD